MVIKTELCIYSEWKIYPGKGQRYVAKDGRVSLFLTKKARVLGLKYPINPSQQIIYLIIRIGKSKPRRSPGPLPGESSQARTNKATEETRERRESSRSKEPSKASPLTPSTESRTLSPKIRKLLHKRQSSKSRKERKTCLIRKEPIKKLSTKAKLKCRKRLSRKLFPRKLLLRKLVASDNECTNESISIDTNI